MNNKHFSLKVSLFAVFVSKGSTEEKQQTPRQSISFKGRVIPGKGHCRIFFPTSSVPDTLFVQ